MTVKLDPTDRIRVQSRNAFVDIDTGESNIGFGVEMYDMHIIELRKKLNVFKAFVFSNPAEKDEFDYGWWADGEIVFNHKRD